MIKNKDLLFSDIIHREIEGLYQASYFSEKDFVRTSLLSRVDNDKTYLSLDDFNNKINFTLDLECGCRDGLYNENAMYAVYEKEDLEKLITKLSYIYIDKYK